MRPTTNRQRFVIGAAIALLAVPTVAVAAHFTDVPNGYVHEPGIDYLEDTGITAGCSATEFCPNDGLTRGQMGTFLHRASGNAPGTDPSVNAAELAGAGPSAYTTLVTVMDDVSLNLAGATNPATSVVIAVLPDAPAGAYVITGQVFAHGYASAQLICRTTISGGSSEAAAIGRVGTDAGHASQLSLPITAHVVVSQGEDIEVRCHASGSDGANPAISEGPTNVLAIRVGDAP